ncbi:MAG: hypothetical protein HKM95_11020 [Inquilinus sp.]|nr:hypothetical protein [Inquilinus sp.]
MARGRFGLFPAVALVLLGTGCASLLDGMSAMAPPVDPQTLIGLAPQQISAVLGEPELQRQEPPAEVWQYRTEDCVFDLYLYREESDSRAVHYEARSRSNGTVDPAQCLGSVVARSPLAEAPSTTAPASL